METAVVRAGSSQAPGALHGVHVPFVPPEPGPDQRSPRKRHRRLPFSRAVLCLLALACTLHRGCASSTPAIRTPEKRLVFVHLTDLHCARRSSNPPRRFLFDIHTKDFIRSFDILECTVAEINRMSDVDFVVVTGDLTDSGKDAKSLRRVKRILDGLRVPYYPVIGDHDRPAVFSGVFGDRLNWSLDLKGWHLAIVDASSGRLAAETVAWLVRDLDAHQATPTLLFMHRPLLMSNVEETLARTFYKAPLNLENAQEILLLLQDRPWVRGVFAGHCHMDTVRHRSGCVFVTTPSLIEHGYLYRIVRVSEDRVQMRLRGVEMPVSE